MERTIYDIVIYIFEMLIAFAFFSRCYEKKLKSNIIILIIGAALFIPISLVFSLLDNVILNLILFFIINFIFAISGFKIAIKNAIIYSILLDAIMFASESFSIFLWSYFFNIPINAYQNDIFVFVILSVISKTLYLAFSQLLAFCEKKGNYNGSNTKQFLPLLIFPILSIASSFIFLMLDTKSEITKKYQIAIASISILYVFACIFIFIYYQFLSDSQAKLNELESEKKFYELNNNYLDVLQHQNDELQMMFHNTKHHYLALSSLNNIDDVKEYIKKIYPDLENKNTVRISSNKLLNLILNKYIVICKQNGIKFSYEVKTADLDYIDDSELSIILNNILDNAVEAAMNSKKKTIDFSLRHINNMDMLNVINSCDVPPIHSGGKLLTTKANSSSHGFGTKIIEKHANINNGKYEWFYDKKEHQFHLSILFQR